MASSSLKIRLIAPSCGCNLSDIERVENELSAFGVELRYDKNIVDPAFHPYAQSVEYRIQSFLTAMRDEEVTHIWAVRGGEGCYHLMEALKGYADELRGLPPKTLIGFSDVCTLGMYFTSVIGMPWIHAPTLLQYRRAGDELLQCLRSPKESCVFASNLTILQSSIGTYYQPDLRGRTLILEDRNEAVYRYERSMYHLLLSGALDGVTEVQLADFDPIATETKEDIAAFRIRMHRRFKSYGMSSSDISGVGHGERNIPVYVAAAPITKRSAIEQ